MPESAASDTHQKALRINLDPSIFGSFAEIGAAQEVARWFLRVGAASGTVAKAVSAYDKEVSDAMYGPGARYVSRARLEAMLDAEWGQLCAQVASTRGAAARLFAFADTVAARNFEGTNDAQGWMGVRFQLRTGGPPGDILLHVNLRDKSGVQQQEALGILGVNLLHALYYERDSLDQFLGALLGQLEEGRLEVDLIDISGPHLAGWREHAPPRLLLRGAAEAVEFPTNGLRPPSEVFYKAPVVLAPGVFDHVAPVHAEILRAGAAELARELDAPAAGIVAAFCLTASGTAEDAPRPEPEELAARAAALAALGSPVLGVRRREYYHVTALINRYTHEPVRFAVGVSALLRIFADTHYRGLEGRILEGISRLFASNVRFYVYPMPAAEMQEHAAGLARDGWDLRVRQGLLTADNARPPPPLGHLYDYLLESRFVVPMAPARG